VRLDEAKIEELRRWGQTLAEADSEGSVAAGRAILMLIEELDRLRIELWRAREQLDLTHHDVDPGTGDQVGAALQRRLQEGGSEAASAHSWIEALRRRR
jgi:hypothetical protein